MQNVTIIERLSKADALLSEHRFDEAVALAAGLEDTVAALDADTGSPNRVPTWTRDRLQSLRCAAEIGRQLAYLAGSQTDPQAGSFWGQARTRALREVGRREPGLRNISIQ